MLAELPIRARPFGALQDRWTQRAPDAVADLDVRYCRSSDITTSGLNLQSRASVPVLSRRELTISGGVEHRVTRPHRNPRSHQVSLNPPLPV
jgi:hypothetical protein